MKDTLRVLSLLVCVASFTLAAQEVATLTSTPVARELKSGESHAYQVTVAANQAAHVVVTQKGADVILLAYDPTGKLIGEMDSPNGTQGNESFWLINQPVGTYRIEVKAFAYPDGRQVPGAYEIKLADLRTATAADSKFGRAQAAYLEARALRPLATGKQKAAAEKLVEALSLLDDKRDPDLIAVINNQLFNVAPMYRIEQLKLTKVASPKASNVVTTYHSADLAKEALAKRALLESMLSFYQTQFKTKFEMSFAMLNQADYKKICPPCQYVMPMLTPAPLAMIVVNDSPASKGMLSMFKSKVPASLKSALEAEGFTYDTATPLVLDAAGYLGLASIIKNQFGTTHAPQADGKPWMASVMAGYLVHAWLGEKYPQLRKQIKLGLQLPGAVLTPRVTTLEGMFSANDMFTSGVAMSRAADLGGELYDRHKLGFLADVLKAFPKGSTADANTAEAKFIALSPLIKPWVDSFASGSTSSTASKAAASADTEVRAAIQLAAQAAARSDKSYYEQYLASDYFETDMDGKVYSRKEILDGWLTPPTPPKITNTLEDLNIRIIGDLAFASYRWNIRNETRANEPFVMSTRNSDVLQRQNGNWRLLSQHYSRIPQPPAAVKIETKILDEYTGHYLSDDGVKGVITREGNTLFEALEGTSSKTELQPENQTTFRLKDQTWQRVFVRDAKGRVTHLLVRSPDGQEFKAKKIK